MNGRNQHNIVIILQLKINKSKKSINTNAGEGVEKRESSYTVGGNVNSYNHYGEQYGKYL